MKQILAILALSGLFYFVSSAQDQAFSLEESVQYALQNSSDMHLKQLEVADADGQIIEFRATGMPVVNGRLDYSHFIQLPTSIIPKGSFIEGDPDQGIDPNPIEDLEVQFGTKNNVTVGADASAMVFDGTFFVGLKAVRLFRELMQKEVKQTESEVRFNVTKAYLAVLISKRNKEIVDKNIANLEKTYEEVKATYESGFAEKLDVDRIELSLSNLRVDAEGIDRLIIISKNLLKFQMGYPIDEPIRVTDELDILVELAKAEGLDLKEPVNYADRPEYKVLESSEKLAEINIQRYRVGYLPRLDVFGVYERSLQANKVSDGKWFPTSQIGAAISVPIFDGLDKKAKIQRAKIMLDERQIQKREFERAMTMEVANARISYLNNLQSLESRKKSLDLAQRIYDTTQIKYREGVGSSVEVTQAERELYAAQSNYINALYDFILAKTELDKALGKI